MKRERKEKTSKGGVVMNILGGSFLTRKDFSKIFPFLVYVTVLLMLIITNAYIAESTSRAIKNNSEGADREAQGPGVERIVGNQNHF